MAAQLEAWLLREGGIARAALEGAVARQRVYGGSLDTAILEGGLMTEASVWAGLAAATGLSAPHPSLCDTALTVVPPPPLDAEFTRPLRVVPVAAHGNTVELLCAEPVAVEKIRQAAAEKGFQARLYVVPEVRLLAMRQRVYGEPLPARYAPLLGRRGRGPVAGAVGVSLAEHAAPTAHAALSGPAALAADAEDGAPTPLERFLDLSGSLLTDSNAQESEVEVEIEMEGGGPGPLAEIPDVVSLRMRLDVVSAAVIAGTTGDGATVKQAVVDTGSDSATDVLCRRARDPRDKGRQLALRALRQRFTHPATQGLLQALRSAAGPSSGASPTEMVAAIQALAELRDGSVVPSLIERLSVPARSGEIAAAAHRALVDLCAQDFGRSTRRWQAWAKIHAGSPRVEWLLDGLTHKQSVIRRAAADELRQLAGDSFNYDPGAPKRQREEARRRFVAWWQATSPAKHLASQLSPSGDTER